MRIIQRNPGVYQIINLITSHRYVGGTVNLVSRKRQHFSDLKLNKHKNKNLQDAYNEYGKDALVFFILETCSIHITEEELIKYEQRWMDKLQPEYNVNKIAGKHIGEYIHTEEAKEKRRNSMKGKSYPRRNPYVFKGGVNPKKGSKSSPETIEKLRLAVSGERNPNYGKPRSPETRRKISESNSKTYKGLIAPDGTIYKDIRFLSTFCEKHGLGLSSVVAVLRGRQKHHKGWVAL